MFLGRFKGFSRKFLWCFEEVSKAFQTSNMDVSRKLQGRLKGVLRKF